MSPIIQSLANGSARGYGAFFGAAAGPAFESIASATGTGSSGTISFTSIPGTYQHLQIRGIMRSTAAGVGLDIVTIRFNSDTTNSNYSYHALKGNGSTAGAEGGANSPIYWTNCLPYDGVLSNTMGVVCFDIQDYASTTKNKTTRAIVGMENNNANAGITPEIDLDSGLWRNTNAITRIDIVAGGGSFTTTTQFALYGIKGA